MATTSAAFWTARGARVSLGRSPALPTTSRDVVGRSSVSQAFTRTHSTFSPQSGS